MLIFIPCSFCCWVGEGGGGLGGQAPISKHNGKKVDVMLPAVCNTATLCTIMPVNVDFVADFS